MAHQREFRFKTVEWVLSIGMGLALVSSAPAENLDPVLTTATRHYLGGDYVKAFQLYERLETRGQLQNPKDRQRWGYCHMIIAYEFFYAYKDNPLYTPTPTDWEEVEGLVHKARRLAPSLTYSDRVLEAIAAQKRRGENFASKGESANLGRKR